MKSVAIAVLTVALFAFVAVYASGVVVGEDPTSVVDAVSETEEKLNQATLDLCIEHEWAEDCNAFVLGQ